MSKQSKIESLLEACINTASGYIIAIGVGAVVYPLFGHTFSFAELNGLTIIFTGISVARGYFWRRFFNAEVHRVVHRLVVRWYQWKRETKKRF